MLLWISSYWSLNFAELLVSQKLSFWIFLVTNGFSKWKIWKTIENLLDFCVNYFSIDFKKFRNFFCFFTESSTISFPVPCQAGDNVNLLSDFNISKTVLIKIIFVDIFKEFAISFVMVCRLMDVSFVVIELLIFKVCGIIGISKI